TGPGMRRTRPPCDLFHELRSTPSTEFSEYVPERSPENVIATSTVVGSGTLPDGGVAEVVARAKFLGEFWVNDAMPLRTAYLTLPSDHRFRTSACEFGLSVVILLPAGTSPLRKT